VTFFLAAHERGSSLSSSKGSNSVLSYIAPRNLMAPRTKQWRKLPTSSGQRVCYRDRIST